jgi:hypothetical protein
MSLSQINTLLCLLRRKFLLHIVLVAFASVPQTASAGDFPTDITLNNAAGAVDKNEYVYFKRKRKPLIYEKKAKLKDLHIDGVSSSLSEKNVSNKNRGKMKKSSNSSNGRNSKIEPDRHHQGKQGTHSHTPVAPSANTGTHLPFSSSEKVCTKCASAKNTGMRKSKKGKVPKYGKACTEQRSKSKKKKNKKSKRKRKYNKKYSLTSNSPSSSTAMSGTPTMVVISTLSPTVLLSSDSPALAVSPFPSARTTRSPIPNIRAAPTVAPTVTESEHPSSLTSPFPSNEVNSPDSSSPTAVEMLGTTTPTTAPTLTPNTAATTLAPTDDSSFATDFLIDFRVVTSDEPSDQEVQDLVTFTNAYVSEFLTSMITEYSVESFNSTLFDLTLIPSTSDPPTTVAPARIRITFDTLVIISADSPIMPTVQQIDSDIAKAFQNGSTFFDYLTMVVDEFRNTPFGYVFGADWMVIGNVGTEARR